MFDLDKAIIALDARIKCKDRYCDDCETFYNTKGCPYEIYCDQFKEVLKLLEKAKDSEWDTGIPVSEEDIIDLFRS